MSSPPRRSLQTRGSNRPTRNALHPPRGARSAVACRALTDAAAPSLARQPGPPRGPRAVARRIRCAPPVARAGQRDIPIVSDPGTPPSRPSPPLASPPPDGCRVPRRRRRPRGGPLAQRGPRSTTPRGHALSQPRLTRGVTVHSRARHRRGDPEKRVWSSSPPVSARYDCFSQGHAFSPPWLTRVAALYSRSSHRRGDFENGV